MDLRKKVMNKLHPILKPLYQWYTSSPRNYQYKKIRIVIFPGVFHPGLFSSTKVILGFLEQIDLKQKKILELGSGSGLISIFCALREAQVTSSDISEVALLCTLENAKRNGVSLRVVKSNLFDELMGEPFDLIIINPPYYPKVIQSEADYGWFCGEDFEYFRKLFYQLNQIWSPSLQVIINFSEDCRIETIQGIAKNSDFLLVLLLEKKVAGEKNFLFEVRRA